MKYWEIIADNLSKASDCVADCVWLAVPKTTKRQRVGSQIDAAMIFAWVRFAPAHG